MSDKVITLTEKAIEQVKHLIQKENLGEVGLRVAVVGGGCSGMSYRLAFEKEPNSYDRVQDEPGLKVFIDPKSSLYLNGIQLDYTDGLEGIGFTFQNPNASKSCSCGESFAA